MKQLILIGASNVTIAFPRLVNGLVERIAEPLEIWGVHGHGRSYGTWSKVLGRSLPGITESRFWDAWTPSENGSTPRAVLTDIGNDILYGHDTTRILEWVETCIKRLRDRQAEIVMTRLPLASLETLSRVRFSCARNILFPGCSLSLAEIHRQAHEVDAGVIALAGTYSIPLTEPQGCWYGIDPIHIRGRWIESAWQQILGEWFPGDPLPAFPRVGLRRALQTWRWWPAERGRRGRVTETPQPVFQHDRLSVRLY
jgi:hypothetical protein